MCHSSGCVLDYLSDLRKECQGSFVVKVVSEDEQWWWSASDDDKSQQAGHLFAVL